MAQYQDKNPSNIPGSYYVDDTCVDCDLCRNMVPEIFARDDGEASSYVHRQPGSRELQARAEEARECCPSESIGNDGAPETTMR